jgi:RNA polymerase sigma-70 factor (ECF subfamily)
MLDRRQYERIFSESYARYYHLSLQVVGDGEVARDVVSDVFVRLWEQKSTIRESSVYSWLFRSVRNASIDYMRRKPNQNSMVDIDHVLSISDDEALQVEDERLQYMEEIIKSLSPRTQLVLRLCYLQQKSYRDVADELGITSQGVKKHIVRAFKVLREKMNVKKIK